MNATVVDTSVLAALAFGEDRADEARALTDGKALHEPALLLFELTNVAAVKSRRDPQRAALLQLGLRTALALHYQWEAIDQAGAFELALQRNLSGYDASYLWLACELAVPLVTFDRRLAVEAERLGVS